MADDSGGSAPSEDEGASPSKSCYKMYSDLSRTLDKLVRGHRRMHDNIKYGSRNVGFSQQERSDWHGCLMSTRRIGDEIGDLLSQLSNLKEKYLMTPQTNSQSNTQSTAISGPDSPKTQQSNTQSIALSDTDSPKGHQSNTQSTALRGTESPKTQQSNTQSIALKDTVSPKTQQSNTQSIALSGTDSPKAQQSKTQSNALSGTESPKTQQDNNNQDLEKTTATSKTQKQMIIKKTNENYVKYKRAGHKRYPSRIPKKVTAKSAQVKGTSAESKMAAGSCTSVAGNPTQQLPGETPEMDDLHAARFEPLLPYELPPLSNSDGETSRVLNRYPVLPAIGQTCDKTSERSKKKKKKKKKKMLTREDIEESHDRVMKRMLVRHQLLHPSSPGGSAGSSTMTCE